MCIISSTLIICVVLLHLQLFTMHLNVSLGITTCSLEIFLLNTVLLENEEFQSSPQKPQILLRN